MSIKKYKGYEIKKWNNNDLDWEISGVQWSIYPKGEVAEQSCAIEITDTLREAKWIIDGWESAK